ncbi:FtsH protease activity modulator HflK [Butyrivibrio sp. VCD2006]|uniref:FtsH protease activity modulator HflK n=1 Tax=Butyrivibrio sp. VCD2006 TaxID=1280664 RepID=UPI000416A992|nr:FtsH protease activity modulator HflK [Butyrivibrio sp. VCD2006]
MDSETKKKDKVVHYKQHNWGKGVIAVVVGIFLAMTVFGSFYNVSEQEQAIVTQFGKVVATNSAGLYFKVPFIQAVHMVDMTTHGIGIGYVIDGNGQNITVEDEGIMITSDFNFVDIDFYLEYKVNDPVAYYYNTNDPETIMKNVALACIRSTVIDYPVDEVITTAKGQIQSDVKELLSKKLTEQNVGLSVVNVSVQDAEPPTNEIKQAFKAVETAKQGKETAVNNAKKYQNEQVPAAEAEADRIVQNAEGAKASRIAEAEGEAAKFNSMYEEYSKYPLITKQRLFYETIENVLPGTKLIITDGQTQEILPLDNFSNEMEGIAASSAASTQEEETTEGE